MSKQTLIQWRRKPDRTWRDYSASYGRDLQKELEYLRLSDKDYKYRLIERTIKIQNKVLA